MVGQLLNMHSQSARLAVESTQPRLNIHNNYPKLNMTHQKGGGIELKSGNIRVQIDQYPCRRQLGESTVSDSVAEQAEKGRQNVLDFIADTARQGDELAKMQPGTLPEIALERTPKLESGRRGYSFPAPPDISWLPNSLKISYTPGSISFSANSVKPEFQFSRGEVNISVARKAYLDIEYTGSPIIVGGGFFGKA